MKRHHSLFSATGIPSLFLIFAVLMLVILSLLGYGTARQDLRASILSHWNRPLPITVSVKMLLLFYTETVHSLKSYQTQAKNEEEYFNLADAYFSSQPDVVWDAASHRAQIKAISDTQSLLVELIVSYPDKDSDPVRITA